MNKHDSIYCRDCIRLLVHDWLDVGWDYTCWVYKHRLRADGCDPVKCLECIQDRAGEYENVNL